MIADRRACMALESVWPIIQAVGLAGFTRPDQLPSPGGEVDRDLGDRPGPEILHRISVAMLTAVVVVMTKTC